MTAKPALSKIARWFSQLGSLIATFEFGSTRRSSSAPTSKAAGATERLRGDDAALLQQRGIHAEQHLLHGGVVGGDALDRQVAARRRQCGAPTLGFRHGAHHRDLAVIGEVHADTRG